MVFMISRLAYNGTTGILNTGVINSKLKWEKSKSFELGLIWDSWIIVIT